MSSFKEFLTHRKKPRTSINAAEPAEVIGSRNQLSNLPIHQIPLKTNSVTEPDVMGTLSLRLSSVAAGETDEK
jgi:hypothetical protein